VDFTDRLVRIYDEPLRSLGDEGREGEEELLEQPPEDVVEWAAALEVRALYVGTFAEYLGRLLSTPRGPLRRDVDPLGEWEAICLTYVRRERERVAAETDDAGDDD
jgi:hypothetical protein